MRLDGRSRAYCVMACAICMHGSAPAEWAAGGGAGSNAASCEPLLHARVSHAAGIMQHAADHTLRRRTNGSAATAQSVQTGASSSCGRKWPSCGALQKTSTRLGCTLSSQVGQRCMLHVARCTLHAARCMLHAARCMLHAARCMLHATRRTCSSRVRTHVAAVAAAVCAAAAAAVNRRMTRRTVERRQPLCINGLKVGRIASHRAAIRFGAAVHWRAEARGEGPVGSTAE